LLEAVAGANVQSSEIDSVEVALSLLILQPMQPPTVSVNHGVCDLRFGNFMVLLIKKWTKGRDAWHTTRIPKRFQPQSPQFILMKTQSREI